MDFISKFIYADFLGKPSWMWLLFLSLVMILLIFDLGVLHKKDRPIEVKESIILSLGYIFIGLSFSAWIWWSLGQKPALQYLTGFVIEKSLAMDNIFIIAMIFSFFAIPRKYQYRVLFWGILGVIILRAILILLGASLISQFNWILTIFAVFLILTGYKLLLMTEGIQKWFMHFKPARLIAAVIWFLICILMVIAGYLGLNKNDENAWVQIFIYISMSIMFFIGFKIIYKQHPQDENQSGKKFIQWLRSHLRVTDQLHGHAFMLFLPDSNKNKKIFYFTPLFLALIVIEVADFVFAVDSVPAIFAITTDPFIVYTSNIFAILGLRALYFALAALMNRFYYLKYALSLVLIFIGSKVFISELIGDEKFPPAWSLIITLTILAFGFIYSIWKTRKSS